MVQSNLFQLRRQRETAASPGADTQVIHVPGKLFWGLSCYACATIMRPDHAIENYDGIDKHQRRHADFISVNYNCRSPREKAVTPEIIRPLTTMAIIC
jgi:hypothetical protein